MKKPILLSLTLSIFSVQAAGAADPSSYDFFREETEVVSASRRPRPASRAPATVYVVTGEDILSSGAQTLWDALRVVPGVDVTATRTFQGEVSIRGLNKALSNRTLVMLDGKTVLNGFFDFVVWEEIPVTLEEIDRIEVVEGPVSALYGANAVNGVINIITKSPESLNGGLLSYAAGERRTHLGSALYGKRTGDTAFKIGTGWRSTYRFEDADQPASSAGRVHGLVSHDFSEETRLSLSGGLANINTQLTTGNNGTAVGDGPTGFTRADLAHGESRLRLFWNRGRAVARDFNVLQGPNLDYDTYDATLDRSFSLPGSQRLTVGGGYRRNEIRSKIFRPGLIQQDLWALFFEDEWRPLERWTLVASGRFDDHPSTPWIFSPRGSVIFSPLPEQALRFSAGSAFRNPTLLENYLLFTNSSPAPNPPFSSVETTFTGNRSLDPERMNMVELSYSGRWSRLKASVALFHYELKDLIDTGPARTTSAAPPTLRVESSFLNRGRTRALGGEIGGELAVGRASAVFANYSYQSLNDELPDQETSQGSPRHKANAGIRRTARGVSGSLWANWVDKTFWNKSPPFSPVQFAEVEGYVLLNARLGYRVRQGRLRGLEVGVSAFNLADRKHYEILPPLSAAEPGQGGEIVRSRWVGTVSYPF